MSQLKALGGGGSGAALSNFNEQSSKVANHILRKREPRIRYFDDPAVLDEIVYANTGKHLDILYFDS